jgi:hypothetical protein
MSPYLPGLVLLGCVVLLWVVLYLRKQVPGNPGSARLLLALPGGALILYAITHLMAIGYQGVAFCLRDALLAAAGAALTLVGAFLAASRPSAGRLVSVLGGAALAVAALLALGGPALSSARQRQLEQEAWKSASYASYEDSFRRSYHDRVPEQFRRPEGDLILMRFFGQTRKIDEVVARLREQDREHGDDPAYRPHKDGLLQGVMKQITTYNSKDIVPEKALPVLGYAYEQRDNDPECQRVHDEILTGLRARCQSGDVKELLLIYREGNRRSDEGMYQSLKNEAVHALDRWLRSKEGEYRVSTTRDEIRRIGEAGKGDSAIQALVARTIQSMAARAFKDKDRESVLGFAVALRREFSGPAYATLRAEADKQASELYRTAVTKANSFEGASSIVQEFDNRAKNEKSFAALRLELYRGVLAQPAAFFTLRAFLYRIDKLGKTDPHFVELRQLAYRQAIARADIFDLCNLLRDTDARVKEDSGAATLRTDVFRAALSRPATVANFRHLLGTVKGKDERDEVQRAIAGQYRKAAGRFFASPTDTSDSARARRAFAAFLEDLAGREDTKIHFDFTSSGSAVLPFGTEALAKQAEVDIKAAARKTFKFIFSVELVRAGTIFDEKFDQRRGDEVRKALNDSFARSLNDGLVQIVPLVKGEQRTGKLVLAIHSDVRHISGLYESKGMDPVLPRFGTPKRFDFDSGKVYLYPKSEVRWTITLSDRQGRELARWTETQNSLATPGTTFTAPSGFGFYPWMLARFYTTNITQVLGKLGLGSPSSTRFTELQGVR